MGAFNKNKVATVRQVIAHRYEMPAKNMEFSGITELVIEGLAIWVMLKCIILRELKNVNH